MRIKNEKFSLIIVSIVSFFLFLSNETSLNISWRKTLV